MKSASRILFTVVVLMAVLCWTAPSCSAGHGLDAIKKRGSILWGADAEGGAPYAFPDPKDPSKLVGFEVDLAQAIARELGVGLRQSQNA